VFKLPFDIPESDSKINLKDAICLVGSCFSDEIGTRLSESKFDTWSNPYGTIYNPHSIIKSLSQKPSETEFIENEGVFYHWDAHGKVSAKTSEDLLALVQNQYQLTEAFLKRTKHLILTFGTAWVYEIDDHQIVANCHKVPASQFQKRLLSQNEIMEEYYKFQDHLNQINPNINMILTVSPIRHIRDGLVENNRSKSILIDAVQIITENHANASYFPAYEIVVDELRDYRFYAEDMVHPSAQAVKYVWERFIQCYADTETKDFLAEWKKVQAALQHRPFHPDTANHQQFLKKTLGKLEKLNDKVDLHVEIDHLKKQIR